jgi:hypothetical protein
LYVPINKSIEVRKTYARQNRPLLDVMDEANRIPADEVLERIG